MTTMGSQRAQLLRMSLLVPYLLNRPGVRIDTLAADLETTPAQIRKDLNALIFCGLPGQGMGDLIEVVIGEEGETVHVVQTAGIDRPLQLTAQEATSLVMALRIMSQSPGDIDQDAVFGALAKIESAVGSRLDGDVTVTATPPPAVATDIKSAIDQSRAIEIDYFVPARDEMTSRVVDPVRTLRVEDVDYVEGWCRRAEGMRVFRMDRIDRLTVLPEPARDHRVQLRDTSAGIYLPDETTPDVTLQVTPRGRWVVDYYRTRTVEDRSDGTTIVVLPISDEETLEHLLTQLGADGLAGLDDDRVAAAARRVAARSREALDRYLGTHARPEHPAGSPVSAD